MWVHKHRFEGERRDAQLVQQWVRRRVQRVGGVVEGQVPHDIDAPVCARPQARAKSEIDNAVAPTGRADECAQLDEYLTRRCVRSGAL